MSRPEERLAWLGSGTEFFDRQLDGDLDQPSGLPGWTRAHVVGHLARNAEALTRLATWARTGTETPMYAGPAQRAAEIEASSQLPPTRLRAEFRTTAAELDQALDSLDETAWTATVRSAKGRLIPATEIPWLRVRELWLHAVDLGADISDLPPELVDALLDDVTSSVAHALLLRPVDRDRTWQAPGDNPAEITGTAPALLAWLTGRTNGHDLTGPRPDLPPWL